MKYMIKPIFALSSMLALGMVQAADSGASAVPSASVPAGVGAPPTMDAQLPIHKSGVYSLDFDAKNYTVKSINVAGQAVRYRAFENIVYVIHPVDTKYERMNVYVPQAYYEGKNIGRYNLQNAPIFFPNSVGGYMPGDPGSPGIDRAGNSANAIAVALSKGYVVAAPGARGRTTKNEAGQYTGKAPAAIVDLKAAVRYLRYNDKVMPGDAEKIISNGTSAGGALSALLGASGNHPDYEPYLQAIGAAKTRDDIFAVSAYCPILNLEHADAAYEWQFNGVSDYKKMVLSQMIDWRMERKEVQGTLTADQIKVSDELKVLFPNYLNSLGLKTPDGKRLILDAQGEGSFKEYVKSHVIASAQNVLNAGTDLSALQWLTIKDGKVVDVNFKQYIQSTLRMKTPPAFDALDLSSGENELFGVAAVAAKHFTPYALNNSTAKGEMADAELIKMMNPMHYLGMKNTNHTQHWRIRHGTIDRDTSLAIPVILATKLQQSGKQVDFALPWNRPHSGDYDLDELFAWVEKITR